MRQRSVVQVHLGPPSGTPLPPANAVSLTLILQNQRPNCGGELLALPVAFTKPLLLRLV